MARRDWSKVLAAAIRIINSYDTRVTLRQLLYRLVSLPKTDPGWIPNTDNSYNYLSRKTAEARRRGRFPTLSMLGKEIVQNRFWNSPADVVEAAANGYNLDRTEGQPYQIWLVIEKMALITQLRSWFREDDDTRGTRDYGFPILALGGHAAQTRVDDVRRAVRRDGRPAILLYAGDHDPSGWDIMRDFVDRTRCWANPELDDYDPDDQPEDMGPKLNNKVDSPNYGMETGGRIPNLHLYRKYRVALTPEQADDDDIQAGGLPRNEGKPEDARRSDFIANFEDTLTDEEVERGAGVQIEVDAIPPDQLRRLYQEAIDEYWDPDAFQEVLNAEEADKERLEEIVDMLREEEAS